MGWRPIRRSAIRSVSPQVFWEADCKVCGSKSFYVPRSNQDGISVYVRCLRPETIGKIRVTLFDGQSWELHAHELAHLSRDLG